jgi:hypothetical protein
MAGRREPEDFLSLAVRRPWWWRFSPRNPEFRDEIESYGASLVVHLLLLLLLGVVTLSGGGGTGNRVGDGAEGQIVQGTIDSALSAQALEQILERKEVKPLEVELPRPNPRRVTAELTRLVRSAPTQQLPGEGIGGGFGGGIGMGIGKDFGDFLGLLKRAGFDCVFVIDATGSMQYVIDEARRKVSRLVGLIQRLVPVARVGLVLYRDRGEEWVVRKSDLTFHAEKLQAFLQGVEAGSGGDWEEAVKDGLEAAVNGMSWRSRAKKVIVLIASSPPHREDVPAVLSLAAEFKRRGGVISTIDVSEPAHAEFERAFHRAIYGTEPESISPLPGFYRELQASLRQIAEAGGGEMVALEEDQAILREVMVVAFGKEWESKLAQYAKEL